TYTRINLTNHIMKKSLTNQTRLLGLLLVVILSLVPWNLKAQTQLEVSGTVIDANTREPLPGVSVSLKGSSEGTSTNNQGQYVISVAKGATLVFSFLGYEQTEVSATTATVNVSLKEDLSELEEVVVVGYGTLRKTSVTSAISKIEND